VLNQADGKQSMPFPFTDLCRNVKFLGKVNRDKFPSVVITPSFASGHVIEGVIGKTSWPLGVKGLLYKAEIIQYRIFDSDTTEEIGTGGGMSLFGVEWDDDMQRHDQSAGGRDWQSFEKQFFQPSSKTKDGFDQFLSTVDRIMEAMDTVEA
jgi:hypothetical protein